MGAPVVSLIGKTAAGRAGLSILSAIGLPELAVSNIEDFALTATKLASSRKGLAGLRADLRPRMEASPLMNARLFARHIEDAYRGMWRDWCAEKPAVVP